MAIPTETIWPIEPHTLAKHQILRNYLGAWLPIMTSFNGRVIYIDGFAGPGRYKGGEEGSPLIALRTALDHPVPIRGEILFIFVEKEEPRAAHLKQELAEFRLPKNFVVPDPICATFDETLTHIMDQLDEQKKQMAPAFAFIDPFGFAQTPFSAIRRLMANQRCEVLITFMYEAITRWLSHHDHPETFDALFGTPRWHDALDIKVPGDRRTFLHDLYKSQLTEDAGIAYVRSFQMVDEGNRTEYFLFFGTHHKTGLSKMKEAMWRADPSGRFQFSDFTNPLQAVLFGSEPDYGALEGLIAERFRGMDATINEIEDFAICDTPFTKNHYKRNVLRRLEDVDPPGIQVVRAQEGRRRGTYPGGTVIRFSD